MISNIPVCKTWGRIRMRIRIRIGIKWKVGSGCRSVSKRCRSKIQNSVFSVKMVGDWPQKSGNYIWWQWNSRWTDIYVLFVNFYFSCWQHLECYILNPDPIIPCLSCAGHDSKPGQVQDRQNHCCGSGSGSELDPDSGQVSGSGFGIRIRNRIQEDKNEAERRKRVNTIHLDPYSLNPDSQFSKLRRTYR